jgi:signal peptidase I
LIGFPNEKIQINQGVVTIFNESNPKGLVLDDSYVFYKKKDDFSTTLGPNEYFVMGDNRAGSSDSRIWGSVPKEDIVGTPILRLLPIDKIAVHPGI